MVPRQNHTSDKTLRLTETAAHREGMFSRSKDRGVGRRTNAAGHTLSGGTFTHRERPGASAVTLTLPPQPQTAVMPVPFVRPARHRAVDAGAQAPGEMRAGTRAEDPLFCGNCHIHYPTTYRANHHICRR